MKAIVHTRYGSLEGLQLQEVEKPIPKDNEVLIRVVAATVTAGDVVFGKLHPLLYLPLRLFGLKKKKIPGHELAGEIEAVGKRVARFKTGDQVFGTTTGLSAGSHAEYICLPESWATGVLALKPAGMTYEEAAAIPVGGMTALQFLRKGKIQRGQATLIYGASGSVGTFAVQLARHFGAEVTGVCSTPNVAMVKSLGAVKVIDYTKEDFIRTGETYDLIFDAVGKTSLAECGKALAPNGTYVTVAKGIVKERAKDLDFLGELVEAGKVKPVIDRCFLLEQTVEAYKYVGTGRKKGNAVVTVAHDKQH